MRKFYLLVTSLLLLLSSFIYGQTVSPFSSATTTKYLHGRPSRQLIVDEMAIEKIGGSKPGLAFFITVPSLYGTDIILELQPHSVFTDNFKVSTSSSKGAAIPYQQMRFFIGKIAGNKNSAVMMSIDANENCFLYINDGKQVSIIKSSATTKGSHILYKEDELPVAPFKENDAIKVLPGNASTSIFNGEGNNVLGNKCVGIYFETKYNLYQLLGSTQAVADHVSNLFGIVSLLYANQGIPIKISDLYIWDSQDPYPGNIYDALGPFIINRPTFTGNIAQLLSLGSSGGGIGQLIPPNCGTNKPHSVAGVDISYSPYPTYTRGIMIIAHELGHNFGSPHTHDCAWPGGKIDNCVVNNACTAPDPNYPGTIMSYCAGYSFTNGFGRLPGNLLRDSYKNIPSTCLFSCGLTPIPPGCAPIPENVTAISLGDTAIQVSWDANGTDTFAVDYKKNGDVFPTTIFTTNTSVIIPGLTYCTTYKIRVQGMCGINAGYFSEEQMVTTWPPPPLCKSAGESTGQGWIESVQVNNIAHQTGDNGGRLLSCDHFSVAYGGLTYLELTPGPLPAYTPMYWRVWIDVNQDGVYDSTESIYTSPVATTGKVYANVYTPVVPLIVGPKLPKIKVAMKAGSVPESCEVFPYGEVEEYLVDFDYTDPMCRSRGESDANEWIARVQVANLDNSSGASGGYIDYSPTTPLIALKKDTTYLMQITSGRAFAQGRRLYYRAWFDFNRNGIFENDELVLDRYSLQLSTVSQSFSVPSSADVNKKFPVRVAVKYMSPPEACEIFPEGEVEDYSANVVDTTIHHKQVYVQENTPLDKMVSLYPIPARGKVMVDISSEKEQHIQIQVMNNKGVVLKTIEGISLQKGRQQLPVNISNYWPGVYFIKVTSPSGDVAVKKFVVI